MNKIVTYLIFFSQACLLYVTFAGAHVQIANNQDMAVYDCEVSEINSTEINNLEPNSCCALSYNLNLVKADLVVSKLTEIKYINNFNCLYTSDGLIRGPPTFFQA